MATLNVSWSTFKTFINNRQQPLQWIELDARYYLTAFDGYFQIECLLEKNDSEDQIDFEDNYKDLGNKKLITSTNNIPNPTSEYVIPIDIRQTQSSIDGTTIFSFRNDISSTKSIYLKSMNLIMDFDGLPVSNTNRKYNFVRFSEATPTSGTEIDIIKTKNTDPESQITDVRFLDTGLITTDVVFEPPFFTSIMSISNAPFQPNSIFSGNNIPNMVFSAGEGMAIRLNGITTTGIRLFGSIVVSER